VGSPVHDGIQEGTEEGSMGDFVDGDNGCFKEGFTDGLMEALVDGSVICLIDGCKESSRDGAFVGGEGPATVNVSRNLPSAPQNPVTRMYKPLAITSLATRVVTPQPAVLSPKNSHTKEPHAPLKTAI